MPNIDTSKVKAIAGEMISINNRYKDDFSAVEQAVNRLRSDWQQPQEVSSAALACFDEIKSKHFDSAIQERQQLAQYLCDAVGIGYEEVENTNKKLLEQLFDIQSNKTTDISLEKSKNLDSVLSFALDPNSLTAFNFLYASTFLANHKWDMFGSLLFDKAPDLVKEFLMGKDYNQQIMIMGLSELLSKMDSEPNIDTVPDEIKLFLKSSIELGKWDENSDFYKEHKHFFENKEFFENLGSVADFVKYGEKGIEALQYVLTNYDFEIQQLELLKETCTDPDFEYAIDYLMTQYTDKFMGTAIEIVDFAIEETLDGVLSEGAKIVTGGLYSVVDLGREITSELTGISAHADGMQDVIAASNINNEITRSYDIQLRKIRSGNYTEADLVRLENTFEITKASTLDLYNKMLKMSDSSQEKAYLKLEIEKINALSCYKPKNIDLGGSGGGTRF